MPTNKLAILQRIYDNKQYERVTINGRKVLIDGTSASITLQVYNALSPANQAKMLGLRLDKMVQLAYMLTRPQRST